MSKKDVKKQAETKKKKKGSAGKVILFLLLIIAVLLLILYFGKGGFGFGGQGDGEGSGESVEAMATTAAQTDVPVTEESGPIVIEINETSIRYGADKTFDSYEAFEEYFYENKSDTAEYIILDKQAIKSVYDSVKALLDSFGLKYSDGAVVQ